jgi:beta-lactamase regulating signal transducer with metallopeptidase domain
MDASSICQQFLFRSINGVYQGIILTVLLALGLRALRKTNAATRHAVLLFTLFLLVCLMVVHWAHTPLISQTGPQPRQSGIGPQLRDFASSLQATALDSLVQIVPSDDTWDVPLLQYDLSEADASETSVTSSSSEVPSPVFKRATSEVESNGLNSKLRLLMHNVANALVKPVTLVFQFPGNVSVVLVALWMAIVSINLFVLLVRLRQIRNLKINSVSAGSPLMLSFEQLRRTVVSCRKAELRISRFHKSPLLLGFFHPVILLPSELEHSSNKIEIEQVLRHELAHVGRYDDWANLVQHFIRAILFFHPGVWWIARRLSLEREIACDDRVLEQSSRRDYALLLVNLARRMQGYPPTLAPGTTNNKNQLRERIDMVLDHSRNTSPRLAKTRMGLITAAVALLAAGATCYAPRVVLAQNEQRPPPGTPGIPAEPFRGPDQPGPDLAPHRPGEPFPPGRNPYPAPPPTPPDLRGQMLRDLAAGERPLEQRLARVEKMLEMLMSHFDLNPAEAQFRAQGLADRKAMREQMQMEQRLRQERAAEFDNAEKRFRDFNESEMREKLRRAGKEASPELKAEMERQSQGRIKEHRQAELQKLQKHLQMLEREKDKIGQAIEKLQKEQEKLDSDQKSEDKK